MLTHGARFHRKTCNRKLAPQREEPSGNPAFPVRLVPVPPHVSATSASIAATCPSGCAFRGAGCYAEAGFTRIGGSRMDAEAEALGLDGFAVALEEVAAVDDAFPFGVPQDGARGGRDLRLHVAGDAASPGAALLLGEAAARWRARGGGDVWTFTHNWRAIHRDLWGPAVSVLASVETLHDARVARDRGYAPAVVVERLPEDGRAWREPGLTVIPCPAQTRDRSCATCRLCMDGDGLHARGAAIAFEAHGQGRDAALVQLRRRNA